MCLAQSLHLSSILQENLSRDNFLQERISEDAAGYVSLHLVNSFNRMRRIGLSDTEVAAALAALSRHVEVDSAGTRIRPRQ